MATGARRFHGIAALVCAGAIPLASIAQEPVARTIRIETEPAGAEICEMIDSQLACDGRTPASIAVEFRSAASAKRLHLVRIGYETTKVLATPSETNIRANLKPRDPYLDASAGAALGERQVRAFINERFRALFHSKRPPEGLRGFDFVGRLRVDPAGDEKFSVTVPVMVEDRFRSKEISSIDRSVKAEERSYAVARALWDGYVAALGSALATAFSGDKRIDNIAIVASYSRTKFTLVDDDSTFQFAGKTLVSSHTERFAGQIQQVNVYRNWSVTLPTGFTELAASKKIFASIFILPPGRAGGIRNFGDVTVLSNDNRSGKPVVVGPKAP